MAEILTIQAVSEEARVLLRLATNTMERGLINTAKELLDRAALQAKEERDVMALIEAIKLKTKLFATRAQLQEVGIVSIKARSLIQRGLDEDRRMLVLMAIRTFVQAAMQAQHDGDEETAAVATRLLRETQKEFRRMRSGRTS